MDRIAVISSNVKSVGYDADDKALEVEFHPGKDGEPRIYRYTPVEQWRFNEIVDPLNSVGRIIGTIKSDPMILCERVEVAA